MASPIEELKKKAKEVGPDWNKYPCCGYEHYWPGAGGSRWLSTGPHPCEVGSLEQIELLRNRKISRYGASMSYEKFSETVRPRIYDGSR